MTDYVDKLLKAYYTGKLDARINERERELEELELDRPSIEDINSGIRAQNKQRTNAVEAKLMRIESDYLLSEMRRQKHIIVEVMKMYAPEYCQVMNLHYGNGKTWDNVAMIIHIDRATAIRWRNKVRETLVDWL